MKKNLKTVMLSLALLAGIGGAYATAASHAPESIDPVYNWTRSGGTTQPGEQSPFNGKTIDEAIENYGCDQGSAECARGVDPLHENEDYVLNYN